MSVSSQKAPNRLIPVLLVLFIVNTFIGILTGLVGINNFPDIIRYLNVILTYACVSVLLWQGTDYLEQYHMDRSTIILLVVTGIFRSRLNPAIDGFFKLIILLFTVFILFFLLKYWRNIPKTKWSWVGVSLLLSLIVVPISVIETFQPGVFLGMQITPSLGIFLIRDFINNLSFISLCEEVLFRGVLWGYLRGIGWNENKIFIGQGVLFWLMHFWRIWTPITFFITIPISTFIYSLLARNSNQIFPSVIAHTITNTIGPILVYYLLN
jgi:membrane protease YdiL (CAAX protease family)